MTDDSEMKITSVQDNENKNKNKNSSSSIEEGRSKKTDEVVFFRTGGGEECGDLRSGALSNEPVEICTEA